MRGLAQLEVLAVGQRLRWRDDDTVTRVDAQRVKVLHVAHGDAVVAAIAHHLVLDLLPTACRSSSTRICGDAAKRLLRAERDELGLVVCDARARARRARTRQRIEARVADSCRGRERLLDVGRREGQGGDARSIDLLSICGKDARGPRS